MGAVLGLQTEKMMHKVQFDTFREKVSDYVIKTLDYPDDVVGIVKQMKDLKMEFETKNMPKDLEDTEKSQAKIQVFQMKCKLYVQREFTLDSNKSKIYSIIWGQCSTGLKGVIQGLADYKKKDEDRDVLWLLEQLRLTTAGIDNKSNKYDNLRKVLRHFLNMRQYETESNDDYVTRFNANAETLKLTAGLGFFASPIIMGKSNPTDDKLLADDEKFRAMCLIQSAEPGRYGDLIDRLK